MVSLLLFTAAPAQSAPVPPYRRLETRAVYGNSYDPVSVVAGNLFFTTWGSTCSAHDLRTLKPRWSFKVPKDERGAYLLAVGDTLFLTTESDRVDHRSQLIALDAKTGRPKWTLARRGKGSAMAVREGVLYLSVLPRTLTALDIARRKPKWTHPLPNHGKNADSELESIVVADEGIALNCGNVTYGFGLNGKSLWREPESYLLDASLVALNGIVWVPSNEGALARSLKTGKPLWRRNGDNYSEFGGVLDGQLVGLDGGQIRAFDPKTGRPKWAHRLGPARTSGGNQYGSILGGRLFVAGINQAGIYDAQGRALWTGKTDEAHPQPVWTDGRNLVAFDGLRLIRYVHGAEPALPATSSGRQAVARRMVARFGDLDAADIRRLVNLKDDAFPALLDEYLATCNAYDVASKSKKDTYPLYSKYHDMGDALTRVTGKGRTPELMKALDRNPKSTAVTLLLTLLSQHGDPKVIAPYFLRELEGRETPGFEMYESNTYVARQYIANSSDPRAVAFMLRQLRDPKGDGTQRFEAYVNLPRTGGEAGRDAVRELRAKRTLLPPLAERVLKGYLHAGEYGAKPKLIAEKTDAQGQAWGLMESGVIGSHGDLWLVRKANGEWTEPLFTGVSSAGVSRWAKGAKEPTVGGKTGPQLVKADWLGILADNPEIRRDADGDGLTDLVEKRLETDPKRVDTDGDGDSDAVDPWPNAAVGAQTEEQKVLAAVFDARYFLNMGQGPALVYLPKGMKRFEMPGRAGVSIWADGENDNWSRPLEQCYDQGVGMVNFTGAREKKELITWSKDRKTASLGIRIYYGGLNGTGYDAIVQKFGDEWFVVSLRMAYIS